MAERGFADAQDELEIPFEEALQGEFDMGYDQAREIQQGPDIGLPARSNMRLYVRGPLTPAPQNWWQAANAARDAEQVEDAVALINMGRALHPEEEGEN